jgi:hypothetical protein
MAAEIIFGKQKKINIKNDKTAEIFKAKDFEIVL